MPQKVTAALLVFAAAWLAHGASLSADWVGDDAALVRDNAVVARGPEGLGQAFGPDAWAGDAERGVWRPVTLLSFCVEAPIWGLGDGDTIAPFGFHLTNLLLHGLASILLLGLGWRLAPGRPILVVAAALVFAVHPLNAQAVGTLVGRADLLALLFALVAARLWIEAMAGRTAYVPLAVLAFFLALLSKETAVGLPLVLLLLEVRAPVRGRGRRLAVWGLLLVPVALWALRWPWFAPDLRAGLDGLGVTAISFFLPVGFTPDRFAISPVSPTALAVGGAVLALGAAALVGLSRRGPAARALAVTALLWGAALVVSPAGLPLLPHFAYLPGIGLAVIGGVLIRHLWIAARVPRVGRLMAIVLVVALGLLTASEGRALADAHALERSLLDRYPWDDGLLLGAARRLREEVVDERRRAALRPLGAEERASLVTRTTRRLAEARSYAQAVLRRADPADLDRELTADAWRELGFLLLEQAGAPEAVDALRRALYAEPWLREEARRQDLPPARRAVILETLLRLARAEEAVGELRQAAVHLEHAAELAPRDVHVLHMAGRTLSRAGEHARAHRRLKQALALARDAAERRSLEQALEAAQETARRAADARLQEARRAIEDQRHAEAIAAYREALAADPTLLRAYQELALYLGQWFGRYEQAYEVLAAGESMLRELAYPPENEWWGYFGRLRAQLEKMEQEDLEEERDR